MTISMLLYQLAQNKKHGQYAGTFGMSLHGTFLYLSEMIALTHANKNWLAQ